MERVSTGTQLKRIGQGFALALVLTAVSANAQDEESMQPDSPSNAALDETSEGVEPEPADSTPTTFEGDATAKPANEDVLEAPADWKGGSTPDPGDSPLAPRVTGKESVVDVRKRDVARSPG